MYTHTQNQAYVISTTRARLPSSDQCGFGLLDVLIASALLSAVALGSLSLVSQSEQRAQLLARKLATYEFATQVGQIFKSPELCRHAMNGSSLQSIHAQRLDPDSIPAANYGIQLQVPGIGAVASGTHTPAFAIEEFRFVPLVAPSNFVGPIVSVAPNISSNPGTYNGEIQLRVRARGAAQSVSQSYLVRLTVGSGLAVTDCTNEVAEGISGLIASQQWLRVPLDDDSPFNSNCEYRITILNSNPGQSGLSGVYSTEGVANEGQSLIKTAHGHVSYIRADDKRSYWLNAERVGGYEVTRIDRRCPPSQLVGGPV
jgi:hypothetical protein